MHCTVVSFYSAANMLLFVMSLIAVTFKAKGLNFTWYSYFTDHNILKNYGLNVSSLCVLRESAASETLSNNSRLLRTRVELWRTYTHHKVNQEQSPHWVKDILGQECCL